MSNVFTGPIPNLTDPNHPNPPHQNLSQQQHSIQHLKSIHSKARYKLENFVLSRRRIHTDLKRTGMPQVFDMMDGCAKLFSVALGRVEPPGRILIRGVAGGGSFTVYLSYSHNNPDAIHHD